MRIYFILFFAFVAVMSVAALAETPEVLVEEQARQKWGPALPDNAVIQVRVADPRPDDATLLSAFWMDRDSGRFLANAVTADGKTRRIQGLALVAVTLPVPNRRMMPGEIVTQADVSIIELPVRRVGAFAITDPKRLIGMQVRRMLAQGRQVMTQSIIAPLVIDRGDRVSIIYDDGGLVLTAPGRALDDAHKDQELRIVNLVSNTSLRAIARSDGIVEVIR